MKPTEELKELILDTLTAPEQTIKVSADQHVVFTDDALKNLSDFDNVNIFLGQQVNVTIRQNLGRAIKLINQIEQESSSFYDWLELEYKNKTTWDELKTMIQRTYFTIALERNSDNRTHAAKKIGTSRTTIEEFFKRHGKVSPLEIPTRTKEITCQKRKES